jgi:hypothetical protein
MNSSVQKAESASYSKGHVTVHFAGGLGIRFPIASNPRLAGAADAALNHIEISPLGLHWPELDEDLSFAGLLRGNYGQRQSESLTRR